MQNGLGPVQQPRVKACLQPLLDPPLSIAATWRRRTSASMETFSQREKESIHPKFNEPHGSHKPHHDYANNRQHQQSHQHQTTARGNGEHPSTYLQSNPTALAASEASTEALTARPSKFQSGFSSNICDDKTNFRATHQVDRDDLAPCRFDSNRSVTAPTHNIGQISPSPSHSITPSPPRQCTPRNRRSRFSDYIPTLSVFESTRNPSRSMVPLSSSTQSRKLRPAEQPQRHKRPIRIAARAASTRSHAEQSEASGSRPEVEIVTIDSDSEPDTCDSERAAHREKPSVDSLPNFSPPTKRPRTALPEVIDVDDDDTLSQLRNFAAERLREGHPKITKYTPVVGKATAECHPDTSETSKLNVSRGGGLFVVTKEGTVEIMDSDDEANMSTTHRVVESGCGLERLDTLEGARAAQIGNVTDNVNTGDDRRPSAEKEAPAHDMETQEKEPVEEIDLLLARDAEEQQPLNREVASGDITVTPERGLTFPSEGIAASQNRSQIGASDFRGHASRSGPWIGNPNGSAANAKGLAERLGLTGRGTDDDLIFDPTTLTCNSRSRLRVQGDTTSKQNDEVNVTGSVTRMQLLDGDKVRPQFIAISSPGSVQPTPLLAPNTVSLNLNASSAGASTQNGVSELNAEGLTSQGLNNLVKQNLLTADATEESESPEELSVVLLPHQKRALAWMTKRESPPDIDDDVVAVDDQCLGGILGDEQGLGKTLSMIALIVKSSSLSRNSLRRKAPSSRSHRLVPDREDEFHDDEHDNAGSARGKPWRTLIICPLSVISQWREEFETKIKREHLPSIYVYHGPKRDRRARRLMQYDVVLTTYPTLTVEYPKILKEHPDYEMRKAEKLDLPRRPSGPLCKINWHRVVLDESQHIKNRGTECWSAVMSLSAEKRWCLTGTPIQNCVDDLYSLFCFIRYKFVPNYEVWNREWKKKLEHPLPRVREKYFQRFQAIAGVVLLRRTKRDRINGRNLLNLPSRKTDLNNVRFADAEELQVYQAVAAKTVVEMNKFIVNGTFIANYTNVLMLFLRLRQACCHPFLIEYTRLRRGGTAEELHPDFATPYSLEQLEEAMDIRRTGYCMVDMLPEKVRELFVKYLGPMKRGTPVPTMFQCSYCTASSTWGNGWTLPCGEIICSNCRDLVMREKACRRCGLKFVSRESVECVFNADHIRKEIHATAILGESSKGKSSVTAAEFKQLMDDELKQRMHGRDSQGRGSQSTGSGNRTENKQGYRGGQSDEDRKRKLVVAFSQHSTKIRMIVQELKEVRERGGGEKTLIFSQWNSMLDIIEFHVKVEGFEICRLDGTMSLSARQQQIKEFQRNPRKAAFLISLHAGGTGLNLTAGNRVILTDVWWNPAVEEQAIDRVHRIGQRKPVHVTRFKMLGTVEEHIYKLCEKKRDAVNSALGEEGKQNYGRTKLSRQEILELFGATAKDVIRSSGEGTVAAQAANNLLNFSGM